MERALQICAREPERHRGMVPRDPRRGGRCGPARHARARPRFSFKTAFDEDYSRFSPGVLLQQANLDLLDHPQIDWVDSCAAPGHPMIDSVWRERRALVWVNIPLSATPDRIRFAMLTKTERLWRRWKGAAAPENEVESLS